MTAKTSLILPVALAAALLGGCASDGSGLFSTSSVAAPEPVSAVTATPDTPTRTATRIDPACAQLAAQIDGLKKDGTIERLEKISAGKSTSVQVKRSAILKQAELNRANADFQAKCGPTGLRAAVVAPAPAAAAATAKTAAKAPAQTGVTIATPTAKTQ
jgi:PBP1b-binding outer membrane lipoprotein LpoB